MDRGGDFADFVRSSRRPGDNRPVTNIMGRRKPKEGSNTSIASTLMDGIHRTSMMMRENESSYTALRGGMEDIDRDELDSALRTFMSDCGARIDELKQKMATEQAPSDSVDQSAHCKGMVLVLLERLDGLSQYFQIFKAFRIKQALGDRSRYASHSVVHELPQQDDADSDLGLSPEEMAAFEKENMELQEQLDSKLEQLRNAEREMSMITSMCELTSRKILEQAQEIDALYDTVVKAVEDIDLGNVQLQKAAEATVSSRVFMLVFLFVASLVLLFLHWYMD